MNAEKAFRQFAQENSWEATKKGFPDFFCRWNGDWALVEVKAHNREPLSPAQVTVMTALSSKGIKCYRWSPEATELVPFDIPIAKPAPKLSPYSIMRDPIIYCQRCQRPFEVPPDKARRKYCDDCRLLVMRESGLATGPLAQKISSKKLT